MKLDTFAHAVLDDLRSQHLDRKLQPAESPLINFASNDYLGLATHPTLTEIWRKVPSPQRIGAAASRLICGNWAEQRELEQTLAEFKNTTAALTFSTGYATALGVIPCLVQKGDVVILDKKCHACLVDGARLSQATLRVFPHNDLNYLESLLQRYTGGKILIITESVFSMDGDLAPLREIALLKEKYGAWLMVDEAHATGLYGPNRSGLVEAENIVDQVEVQMGTLSKALGCAGGYVAGSQVLIDLLINRARPFIFSTAPPPFLSLASQAALRLLRSPEGENLRQDLWQKLKDFCPTALSPICPVVLGSEEKALAASQHLRQKGYWVPAVRYPTVAQGQARLRITVNATHSLRDLNALHHELQHFR